MFATVQVIFHYVLLDNDSLWCLLLIINNEGRHILLLRFKGRGVCTY